MLYATDQNKCVVQTKFIECTPNAIIGGKIGHVSLHFDLRKPRYTERTEIPLGSKIKLIFDGTELILVLSAKEYEKW